MDIIVDVDGTLMNIEHRRHLVSGENKDWKAFSEAMGEDTPNDDIFSIVKDLQKRDNNIIITTGRSEDSYDITIKQLREGGIEPEAVYMRAFGSFAPDFEIKKQMLGRMRKDGYYPTVAFDDRKSVVDMWRGEGLRALQVAPGDF